MKKNALHTKDIITAVLLSLINIVIFSVGSFMYFTPITILLMPVVYSLFQGIVFFMLGAKLKKGGVFMIYCVIQGVVAFNLPYLLVHLAAGVTAELILRKTGYDNPKGLTLSYVILQLLACFGSTIYPYAIILQKTLSGIEGNGNLGADVAKAGEMIQSWGCAVLILVVIVSALSGAWLGYCVMKKHLLRTDKKTLEEKL